MKELTLAIFQNIKSILKAVYTFMTSWVKNSVKK